jgi:chromosome segregation and condensation protein ScpB
MTTLKQRKLSTAQRSVLSLLAKNRKSFFHRRDIQQMRGRPTTYATLATLRKRGFVQLFQAGWIITDAGIEHATGERV